MLSLSQGTVDSQTASSLLLVRTVVKADRHRKGERMLYSGLLMFRKLRAASIAAISAFSVLLPGAAIVNAQDSLSSANSDQLAAAIARTMRATNPVTTPDFPIAQQISFHGHVVETRNMTKDAQTFVKLYADKANYENVMTRNMCEPERRRYIQRGVVFHFITEGPGASASFEFNIDEKACASLADPESFAAPRTVQRSSQKIAGEIAEILSKEPITGGLQYENTIVLGTEIEVTELVKSQEMAELIKAKDFQFRGMTQGWFCGKFEPDIRSGVRIHIVYKSKAGLHILEFPIDRSVC